MAVLRFKYRILWRVAEYGGLELSIAFIKTGSCFELDRKSLLPPFSNSTYKLIKPVLLTPTLIHERQEADKTGLTNGLIVIVTTGVATVIATTSTTSTALQALTLLAQAVTAQRITSLLQEATHFRP